MIVFGNHTTIPYNTKEPWYIINLSSPLEGVQRINIMPPYYLKFNINDTNNFDIQYLDYIFSNDTIFYEFMDKLIIPIYLGWNVYVINSNSDEIFDYISESIQKILQQRYGLLVNNVSEYEDYDYIEETSFSLQGVYNLQIDKERYSMLYAENNKIQVDED